MRDSKEDFIRGSLAESARVKGELGKGEGLALIAKAAEIVREALTNGKKILLCGNGGSAADCQHLASELIGRFGREGRGLPAIALTADTSVLTSLANDAGYENVFSHQIEAMGRSGDVLVAISTSGRSANILRAAEMAKALGMKVIGLTGQDGDSLIDLADLGIRVPSEDTSRIQESHITIGHIVCQLADRENR